MLELVYYEVFCIRAKKDYAEYLPKGTKTELQSDGAKYLSGNKYGIEYVCVDAGPVARIRPKNGANLIVVPAGLVANWLAEINKYINLYNNICDW